MFGEIVRKVVCAWPPVYAELSLSDAVAQPVEPHVHCLASFLFDGIVHDARRTLVVALDGCAALCVT